jgi:nicotinate-nucleotide--dimethylbenzimidazole phosphoribosyltransferase
VTLLEQTCRSIAPVCTESAREAQARLDAKTKPRGSLGRLEELACRLTAIYRTPDPPLPAGAIVVMAADHGVAEEGVSAYPQEVTAQMLRNFAEGGAAINVLARMQKTPVMVVDMGTRVALDGLPQIRRHRLGPGTANMTRGPAMSRAVALNALEIGVALATELHEQGVRLLAVGEMGIANSTAASAIAAVLLGLPAEQTTGRGTGLDDDRLQRKIRTVERARAVNRPERADPIDVLAKVGGFEIAALAGLMLGAAAWRMPVVLDGFITGAAALAAVALCPTVRDYLIAAHRSTEPGHRHILRHLELRPLFELDMRLGEGTGAALALTFVDASLRLLREMATFQTAGVTDTGA